MSDVFYLRPMNPPIAPDSLPQMVEMAGGCLDLHRVEWKKSFLARDGARMLCWYRAADAESVRLALRTLGSNMSSVHAGHPLARDTTQTAAIDTASVLAELAFGDAKESASVELALISKLGEEPGLGYLEGFKLADGSRMILFFESENEHAIRTALEALGVPLVAIWSGQALSPPSPG